MEAYEFQKKLVTYICDSAKITNKQLAAAINMKANAFSNRLTRGTLPLVQLQGYMDQRGIPMPSWAVEPMGSTELRDLKAEVEQLKKDNEELERKLAKAEERQDQLNSMLHNAIMKLTQ